MTKSPIYFKYQSNDRLVHRHSKEVYLILYCQSSAVSEDEDFYVVTELTKKGQLKPEPVAFKLSKRVIERYCDKLTEPSDLLKVIL